jgi:cell wall-associated NlpC family hydrolase
VTVATPAGARARLRPSDVVVHRRGSAALAPTGSGLVASAQQFTGLPYLWAGRSGFGFDCSGLTSLDYRVHGVTIPRDAAPQSTAGRAVAASARAPGDLLFFARDGVVHHVAMYAGGGLMVHAPSTGSVVQTIAVSTPSYARELVGTRRYLG